MDALRLGGLAGAAGSGLGGRGRVWAVRSVAEVRPARHGLPEVPAGRPSIPVGKTATGSGHSDPAEPNLPSGEGLPFRFCWSRSLAMPAALGTSAAWNWQPMEGANGNS